MSEFTPLINRLPTENLIEIFSLVQADGVKLTHRKPGYPWRVSLVCRLWKNITFAAPQLWANIHIEASQHRARNSASIAMLELYLKRSQDYPLTASVVVPDKAAAFIPSFIIPFVRHASHWGDIFLDLPLHQLAPFISDPNIRYPRLRSLGLRAAGPEPPLQGPHLSEYEIFTEAPSLSKLSLFRLPNPRAKLGLPWSQITDFTALETTIPSLLTVLPFMSNLSSLLFRGVSVMGARKRAQVEGLEFPHLQKLSWHSASPDNSLFFNSVRAPRLTALELSGYDWDLWRDSFESFIQRSGCTVTSIRLVTDRAEMAPPIIRTLPALESVTFEGIVPDGSFIHDLTVNENGSNWIGPKITRLVFDNLRFLGDDLRDKFVSMVRSRLLAPENAASRGCRLRSLHIVQEMHVPAIPSFAPSLRRPTLYQILKEQLSPQLMDSVTYVGTDVWLTKQPSPDGRPPTGVASLTRTKTKRRGQRILGT